MGVSLSVSRKARTIERVFFMVWPPASARWLASWMAGPSAMGSVKGMPSSMMSAPAPGSAFISASEVS